MILKLYFEVIRTSDLIMMLYFETIKTSYLILNSKFVTSDANSEVYSKVGKFAKKNMFGYSVNSIPKLGIYVLPQ